MSTVTHNIRVEHEKFGILVNENFVDATQFKLFLKVINGSLVEKEDLTIFNGKDFLVHIPYKFLVESIILTNMETYSLSEHLKNKSKIES